MKSRYRSHFYSKRSSKRRRAAQTAILLTTLMTVSGFAQSPAPSTMVWIPSDPLNITLQGTHQYDLWLNLSSSLQTREAPGYGFMGMGIVSIPGNTGFGMFPGTADWGTKTIKSQFFTGETPGELLKISNGTGGGPFPSGSTIYYGGASPVPNTDGGTLGARTTAVENLSTVAFQLSLGEAYGYTLFDQNNDGIGIDDMPLLKLYDADGFLIDSVQADFYDIIKKAYNGSLDMPPGSGVDEDIYINTFGLQWDLSAYGSGVASFQIDWTGVQHAQLWSFRIDQSDASYDSYVFDISATWTGAGDRHWNSAANWSGSGVPSEVGKAIIATGSEVIISEDTTIGQVTISSSEDVEIKSTNDAILTTGLNIVTEADGVGTRNHLVSADLNLPSIVTLDVGEDTTLEITGNIVGQGFYKRGEGDLTLTGDAALSRNMIFAGGTSYIKGQVTETGATIADIKNARVVLLGDERFGPGIGVKLAGTSTIGQTAYLQLGDESTGGITQTLDSLDAAKPGYVKDLNPLPQTDPPVYVVGGSDEISTLIVKSGTYSGYLGGSGLYEDNLELQVTGNLTLQGTSTYDGDTVVKSGGVLTLNRRSALSEDSNLVLNGGMLGLGSFSYLIPGGSNQEGITVTESYERFELALGSGPGQVRFDGDGGFRAVYGERYVNLGGNGETVIWNENGFVGDDHRLILGSIVQQGGGAAAALYFENGIDFGAQTRTIEIEANSSVFLTGALSGSGGWRKTGSGTVTVTSPNTYAGVTNIDAGFLRVTSLTSGGAASTLGSSSSAAENLRISSGSSTGHLVYVGEGDASTDRLFTIAGAEGSIANESSSGAVHFTNTGAVAFDYAGATAIQLRGTNNETNRFDLLITDNGSYQTSLKKGGASGTANSGGVWRIGNEANTYTGFTFINSGILEVTKLADGGIASSIGASSSAAANLRFFRGGLRYVGAGDSTDRLISVSAFSTNAPNRIESSGTGALKFTNTGAIGLTSNAAGNVAAIGTGGWLALGGSNSGDNTFASAIGGTGTTQSRLTKEGEGRWIVSGNNSYKGITEVLGGTLSVFNLQNGGVNSNIGSSTEAAANLVINGGKLQYLGGGNSTNRLFTLGVNGGGLAADGTGAVRFTNQAAVVYSGAGDRTLTLSGASTAANQLDAAINDIYVSGARTGVVSIAKEGEGVWVLGGNNSYSGGTLITGGELIANSATALGSSTVVIRGGRLSIAEGVSILNDISVEGGTIISTIHEGNTYSLGSAGVVRSGLSNTVNVTASIVASQAASTTSELSYSFGNSSAALNDSARRSAVLSLEGTGDDIFVLQLATSELTADDYLGWYDEDSQLWVNAVLGNSDSGDFAGRYEMSWEAFMGGHASAAYSDLLGAWGVDLGTGTVWAVLDHNSDFAAIPEPSTWVFILSGAVGLIWAGRRRRTA